MILRCERQSLVRMVLLRRFRPATPTPPPTLRVSPSRPRGEYSSIKRQSKLQFIGESSRHKREASPWGEAPAKQVMRGRFPLCYNPSPPLTRSLSPGRSLAQSVPWRKYISVKFNLSRSTNQYLNILTAFATARKKDKLIIHNVTSYRNIIE